MKLANIFLSSLFCISCLVSCQSAPPQAEPNPVSICEQSGKARACIEEMRNLKTAEKWSEFEDRFVQLCRQDSVTCERREISENEKEKFELEQAGDALFFRTREGGQVEVYFIRTAPEMESETVGKPAG